MEKNFRTYVREARFKLHNLRSDKSKNVYHCCVQKTASQWFRIFFQLPFLFKYTRLSVLDPHRGFLDISQNIDVKFPAGRIVTPLYITYPGYKKIENKNNSFAFFVKRNPLDIIVSAYYSYRDSHRPGKGIDEVRVILKQVSKEDGIRYIIDNIIEGSIKVMIDWENGANSHNNVAVYKFEDLFGKNQQVYFEDLMSHCQIDMPKDVLQKALEIKSFENFKKNASKKKKTAHYRSGKSNDWVNHISDENLTYFYDKFPDATTLLKY